MADNQLHLQRWVDEGGQDTKPFYGESTRFDGVDSHKSTDILRDRASQIVNISDIETRKQRTVELVAEMDTNALLDTLQLAGINADRESIHAFLHTSAKQAVDQFDDKDLSPQRSAKSRADAQLGAVGVTEKYLPQSGLLPGNFNADLNAVDALSRELATAFVDQNWEKMDIDEKKIELFLFVTYGAHTRWATGQIERQLREGGNPVGRPIFGDLRRVFNAVEEQMELDDINTQGSRLPHTSDEIRERAIGMIERDWKEFWEVASGQKAVARS